MCLFKTQQHFLIASEDIECYKILTFNLRSKYYNYQYKLGQLHKKVWDEDFIQYANKQHDLGGNMFHVSLDKEICEEIYGDNKQLIQEVDENGKAQMKYHCWMSSTQVMVKCIIPRGSRYYKGTYTELGCEQLIVKEILNPEPCL